ncbi:MAG: DUF6265 family protein [Bacteroidia bacterium]
MTKLSNYFIGSIFTIMFAACSGPTSETVTVETIKSYKEIEKANWFLGSWQNNSPEGNMVEMWKKKNDSTLAGKSFFIVGKDTVSSEIVSLEQRGKDLFYIPTVKDQNGAQAIKFTLTNSAENTFVFENPQHDFPTKITYKKINNDSLVAEISGIQNGKERTEQFPMSRSN